MEFLIYLILLLLIPLFLLLTKRSSKGTPPGSMGLPIIGHSISLLQAMRANTGEKWFQERIRKYGPISKLSLFGTPTVFLHGQAANKFIYTCDGNMLANQQPASIRRICGERNIMELRGDDHKRVRGALISFLKPEVLKQYCGRIDEEIRKHLELQWIRRSSKIHQSSTHCALSNKQKSLLIVLWPSEEAPGCVPVTSSQDLKLCQ